MKKFFSFFMLIILFTGTFSSCTTQTAARGVITIAVAESKPGTEAEPNPYSLYGGVLMAAEHINALGGINGYSIRIAPYADNNDAETAKKNAQSIIENDVLAVIGHSSAETTISAAPIYQEASLAAIVASPITKNTIVKFPNYFNISYTSEQQGAYLANYAINVLKINNAMIVYQDESSNSALAKKFENTFRGLGGNVELNQTLSPQTSDLEIQNAVGKIFSANSGLLLIAASDAASATLVEELKNRGFQKPILGGDNLSARAFAKAIQDKGIEKVRPGYYTDGIVTTRTLLADSASGFTSQFVIDFHEKYPDVGVSNAAARGYDAALAIFRAIQMATQSSDAAPSRASVAEAMHNMDDPKATFYGVTGPIYFSHERFATRQPLLGVYSYGHLISAPIQYQPILIPEKITDLDTQIKRGHIITLDGNYVYVTHVIYTGMDIIEIRDLDQKESVYTADFYLWFRYIPDDTDPDFQPETINFTNAESMSNNNLIRSEVTSDGSVYKTYRIAGVFKNEFHFQAYPFDHQDLLMQFRNQNAEASFIQYVIDRPGMRYPGDDDLLNYLKNNGVFDSLYGWKPLFTRANQSLFSTTSTLGDPLNFGDTVTTDFSLFDIHIRVERDSLAFVIKSLLPLLFTLVLAYITFFLPLGHSERLGVGSTALLTTAFFHLSLSSTLPEIGYTVAMEYFFYAAYTISAMIVFLETWSIRIDQKAANELDDSKKIQLDKIRQNLNVSGRIIYPSILFFVVAMGWLNYIGWVDLNPKDISARRPVQNIAEHQSVSFNPTDAPNAQTENITLELITWRPEDDAQIKVLLNEFHKQNPNITIMHLPVSGVGYRNILSTRLDNEEGPDLFFTPPFMQKNAAFSLDLSSLPIEENFGENFRTPWQDTDGAYFGMPYIGVIQAVYYNKDIFNKLQLPVPATWEEFLASAEIIKQAGYIPIGNSLEKSSDDDMFMDIATNFIGGPKGRLLYNVNNSRCFNDENAVRAFQSILDITPYMSEDFKEISSYTSKQRFINEEAAMLFGGSWDIGYFTENAKFDWDVFATPAPAGSQTYIIFQPDVAISINKNTTLPKQEAALRFLEWLMTEDGLNLSLKLLPGLYPLSSQPLNPVDSIHSAQFQKLATTHPADLRWAYSEISATNQMPSAADLVRKFEYAMVSDGITAQQAADGLQAGLAQWYEPAQTCKK